MRVQHHPSRAALLPRLLDQLTGFADVEVVADPGGSPPVNPWRTYRLCLQAMPADADRLLILQDDVILRDDFAGRLEQTLTDHPEQIVCLFVPGFPRHVRLMAQASDSGSTYMQFVPSGYLPLVATILPATVVRALLGWTDANPRIRGADDWIVARFCRHRRLRPVATVPCLVDHDDTVSRVGYAVRQGQHRRAAL